jgi:hypothetical protein
MLFLLECGIVHKALPAHTADGETSVCHLSANILSDSVALVKDSAIWPKYHIRYILSAFFTNSERMSTTYRVIRIIKAVDT